MTTALIRPLVAVDHIPPEDNRCLHTASVHVIYITQSSPYSSILGLTAGIVRNNALAAIISNIDRTTSRYAGIWLTAGRSSSPQHDIIFNLPSGSTMRQNFTFRITIIIQYFVLADKNNSRLHSNICLIILQHVTHGGLEFSSLCIPLYLYILGALF